MFMFCTDYYAAWLIVLKIAENGQANGPLHKRKRQTLSLDLHKGKTLEISKELSRDHRTIKRFGNNVNHKRKRNDKGVQRKLTRRQVSAVKREAAKHPLLTSKQLLEKAKVSEVPRTSRCRLLQTVAKSVKPNIRLPLTRNVKQMDIGGAGNSRNLRGSGGIHPQIILKSRTLKIRFPAF